MTSPVVTIPAVVLAAEFPTNTDRVAGVFNSKAVAWANSENAMVTRSHEIAEASRLNAVVANQAATEANASAGTALAQVPLATAQASGVVATGSAKDWATKVSSEVVAGQGFGAKKYANDSSTSAAASEASAAGTTATGSAKDWATKVDAEVVAGQGFGAKKYANDSSNSAAASETSRIQASKLNLGPKSTPPTKDNQGEPLLQGATYYDTALSKWRVYGSSGWVEGVSAIAGVSSVNGSVGSITLKTVNSIPIDGAGDIPIPVLAQVLAPNNLTPVDVSTVTSTTPNFTFSQFFSLYGVSHSKTQLQLSTNTAFSSTVYDSGELPGTQELTISSGAITTSTTYYWRVRYKNSLGSWSAWSNYTSFMTASQLNSFLPTPEAAPAFGTAFGGGFYAGKIWNETTQSATSTLIATGTKVFAVVDMTATPLFYSGQVVEVRSRANPANKMVGTVSGAMGTSLTVTVTSVDGSGTFTDWSVMARYNIIVAPKSSGDNASIAYKNAATAAPAATGTLTEGRKATLAMVAADNATVYPAAHWANNLNINGKTDWYLPARDELELCWRNLKPTTNNNYTTANRPAAATPNYQNLGSYGGTEATHGLNKNSDPSGAAYTATVPAQTTAAAFKTGGAEAFEFGSSYYWSSTEYNATLAWNQGFGTGNEGTQSSNGKSFAARARAARRQVA